MINIVDYGLGNVQAFANIYKRLGIPFAIARHPAELHTATRLILPGVGAFDWAIKRFEASGFLPVLNQLVLSQKIPVLGICVGMQIMANSSEEGRLPGLGWIPGEVKRFDEDLLSANLSLPHMGWNDVTQDANPLFSGITEPRFYFLHSYYFVPASPDQVLAKSEYGTSFAASVCKDNVVGVQFHPEKSHHWGVQLLQNFANFNP